ncbi:PREDICTED: p53-induced death domain-containing protein 1 [Thamnophis sirtalis]|uniref:P53-induced death domain-containing protein 1 n=1 Tax=Thamnophis sirtalis TaxID=35019 RepID=A0A6I9XH25_9SAUR|nr:PREDICTED: p53-induced death domain-containing protein 1 [Thamnophis sirtalis]
MAGLPEPGYPPGEGTLEAEAFSISYLAGNRLNLDVYPESCRLFLKLLESRREEVEQVEFLRLNCNEDLITSTLSSLPALRGLKSLVLKGGHSRDDIGAYQKGLLASLPQEFGQLQCLAHLDLSFNSFTILPPCITKLASLSFLSVNHNNLQRLPEDFGQLAKLTFFSAMKNQLKGLPQSIGGLAALQTLNLSENALESLPEEIGNLHSCTELDLSENELTGIPSSLANLQSLQQLHLHSNLLTTVPASLACLPHLSRLDLQNNRLRSIPPEIESFPFVHLRGNPLGELEVPLQSDDSSREELQSVYLKADENSFTVTPEGCRVFLACGIQLRFPLGATTTLVTIHFRKCFPDPHWVKLKHHDILLSEVLELQPHGIHFQQEVRIWMPYASPQSLNDRELIIRNFDGQKWSDLKTRVKSKGKKHSACCSVSHFSWFLVVSRLVENECKVCQEGGLLFSTVDPNIKVTFPPGVTEEMRTVKLQVLPVLAKDLREITGDSETVASPLLCLSQSSTVDFLQPVKIQLPLPPGVTGLTLDRSRVHLLHSDWDAQNWSDITDQVILEFTHLYALFEVTHFSWYWLWCTTKAYIGGFAKEVYKRLRETVSIALTLAYFSAFCGIVIRYVDPVLKKLHDRYRGPEPSDIVEMFEGEQFFAAFEQGISIDAGEMSNSLSTFTYVCLYNSSLVVKFQIKAKTRLDKCYPKSVIKVIDVEVQQSLESFPSGKMSFFKSVKLKTQVNKQSTTPDSFSLPPLNLGNAETGYLTQSNLLGIAGRMGAEWRIIGLNLGLSYQQLERIQYNNREDLHTQILDMLFSWAQQNEKKPDCIDKLIKAMQDSGRQDIADEITTIIGLGRQKYTESIQRVGLHRESSTEDSAIVTG